jgi:arylsulfatase A-like enzyme
MDTFRRDHLGCYGSSPVNTKHIDRFASEATIFENSFISSYPCMPARCDLWTGQLSFLRRGWAPLEYDQPDLVTLLGQNGARTALFTDHYHYWQYGSGNYTQSFHAAELIRGQENDNYKTGNSTTVDYPASPEKLNARWERYFFNTEDRKADDDYFTAQIFNKAGAWLDKNKDQENFFLMMDFFDPHEPFDPPLHYAEKYLPENWKELIKWPKYGNADNYSKMDVDVIHALYCAEIEFLDHCFGKFYSKLEKLSLLENTAIIFTSDHGWLFGEHNWLGKHSRVLFNDIVRTPLILKHPALERGKRKELVQMCDLMPTVLDIMNIPIPPEVQGKSAACLWDAQKRAENDLSHRDAVIFGVFGGETYCTDSEYILIKAPNKTNTPLYWYTRSHFNNWDFGQKNYWQDSIKRIEQFDGKRFPVQYRNAYPRHAAPEYVTDGELNTMVTGKIDELYHIPTDPLQQHNLAQEDAQKAAFYRQKMECIMREHHAPEEQFVRLCLLP